MTARIENLSAYVVCFNEAGYIAACLRSLAFCGEIVVVDSHSTDGTLGIIERLTAEGLPIKLFERDWPGYALQKQFALDQCTGEWRLCVDADERAEPRLAEALPRYLANDEFDAWRIENRPYLYGYGYPPSGVRTSAILRLSRKGRSHYDLTQKVHESLVVEGKVGTVGEGVLLHRRVLTVTEQMKKEIVYARLKAEQLFEAGRGPRWVRLIFNPTVYFIRLFFGRRLFLCGWSGFVHAGTTAAYSFMTETALLQMHMAKRNEARPDPDNAFLETDRD